MRTSVAALTVATALLAAWPVSAQARPAGRLEVGGGVGVMGAIHFASVPANEIAPGGNTLTLFQSRSGLETTPAVVARLGVRIAARWWAESAFGLGSTNLVTDITHDRETGAATVSEPVTQYAVEGGLALRLRGSSPGRLKPFLGAGGGYLRQVHDGRMFVDTGWSAYAGGGIHYLLKQAATGAVKGLGIRVDARAAFAGGGTSLDGDVHVAPAAGASVFVRF